MVRLYEAGTDRLCGTLTDRQFEILAEALEEDDLEDGDCPIDRNELLVILDFPRDGSARQITAYQKSSGGPQRSAYRYTHRAKNYAEDRPSPKREH